METTTSTHRTLDGRGKTISTYVLYEASTVLDTMDDVLEVITDDFEPFPAEIAAWCDVTGQRLLQSPKV